MDKMLSSKDDFVPKLESETLIKDERILIIPPRSLLVLLKFSTFLFSVFLDGAFNIFMLPLIGKCENSRRTD